MSVAVRPLRADEGQTYLEIVNRAICGLAATHYSPEAIDEWIVPITDETLRDLMVNADHELRLVAELDGSVVGIGALILERSELRACYVIRTLRVAVVARRWSARSSGSPGRMASRTSKSLPR